MRTFRVFAGMLLAFALGRSVTLAATAPNAQFIISVQPPNTAPPSLSYDLKNTEGASSFWPANDNAGAVSILDEVPTTTMYPDTLENANMTLGYLPSPTVNPNTTGASCNGSSSDSVSSAASENPPTTSFTIRASVRPAADATAGGPLLSIASGANYIGMWMGDDHRVVGAVHSGSVSVIAESSSAIPASGWNSVDMRFDDSSNTLTIFANGSSVGMATANGSLGTFSGAWEICHSSAYPSGAIDVPSNLYYEGGIADISVVLSAVSNTNIALEYRSMTATQTIDPTPPPIISVGTPTMHPAIAAANLIDSSGVDVHFANYPTYSEELHSAPFETALLNANINHARDSFDPNNSVQEYLCSQGVKFEKSFEPYSSGTTPITTSTVQSYFDNMTTAQIACVDHIEGPNEYDSTHTDFATVISAEQKTLWNAMRNGTTAENAKLANIEVWMAPPSQQSSYASLTPAKLGFDLDNYVDLANAHLGGCDQAAEDTGGFGGGAVEKTQLATVRAAFATAPIAVSEFGSRGDQQANTGWQSDRCYTDAITSAKYMLRDFLFYKANGFSRFYFYQFASQPSDDFFGGEGITDQNGNGSLRYYAFANFMKVINALNPTPNRKAAAGSPLYYGLSGSTNNLEIIPVAQSDGSYDVIYWIGLPSWDITKDESGCPGGTVGPPEKQGNCGSGNSNPVGTISNATIYVTPQPFTIGALATNFKHAVNYVSYQSCNAAKTWHDLAWGQPEPSYPIPVNSYCYPYIPTSATISGQAVNLIATDMPQILHISASSFTPVASLLQTPLPAAAPVATPNGSNGGPTYAPWPIPTPVPTGTPVEVTASS